MAPKINIVTVDKKSVDKDKIPFLSNAMSNYPKSPVADSFRSMMDNYYDPKRKESDTTPIRNFFDNYNNNQSRIRKGSDSFRNM